MTQPRDSLTASHPSKQRRGTEKGRYRPDDRPIKLVHVIGSLGPGGAENMLYKVASRLETRGFRQAVIVLTHKDSVACKLEEVGIVVHTVGMRPPAFVVPRHLARFWSLTAKLNPTLVQGWMYHGNLASLLFRLRTNTPVLWNIRQSVHSIRYEKASSALMIRTSSALSKLPHSIIYNSERAIEQHARLGFDQKFTTHIPNGFDCTEFRPDPARNTSTRARLGIRPDEIVVGMIARLHRQKDHGTFFKAACKVAQVIPSVRFLLAGHGIETGTPALEDLIPKKIRARVGLLGRQDNVPALLAALDIAVSSSNGIEGFPNAIGEAMSCGVPCVVTDVGDCRTIVGPSGLTVPPNDPNALAQAITTLADQTSEYRKRIGREARKRIEDDFNLNKIVEMYERNYNQVFDRHQEVRR